MEVDGSPIRRWDGEVWTSRNIEPCALHASQGQLWALAQGGLWVSGFGDWPRRVDVDLVRPWALGSLPGELWIGEKGGLVRLLL